MIDPQLLEIAVLKLIANTRDLGRFQRELRKTFLETQPHGAERERREHSFKRYADAVNELPTLQDPSTRG